MNEATRPPTQHPIPLAQDARVIALVGLAHAASHFGHLLLVAMFPVFLLEFSLSYAQLGFLTSVFFVVSGVGQAGAGFVVDRFGARPLLFTAVGLFALASLSAAAATGYATLVLTAALAGLANATFHPVDFTILNQRVSSARLGYAFSVHGLTGNLGWALAPVFLTGLAALTHWRTAYLAAAGLYGAILLLLWLFRGDLLTRVVVHGSTGTAAGSLLAILRLGVVWWCFGFFMLSTMTLAVVQNFSVAILRTQYGVSLEAATFTLSAYMLCGALGMFVGGMVAVRTTQSDRVVATAMFMGAVLLGLCGLGVMGASATMAVLALTGFAIGIGGPSRDMMIKRATPTGATGRVYGLVYSGLDVGFAIAPVVFGVWMDRGMFGATLLGAALVLLLSVGAALAVGARTPARA